MSAVLSMYNTINYNKVELSLENNSLKVAKLLEKEFLIQNDNFFKNTENNNHKQNRNYEEYYANHKTQINEIKNKLVTFSIILHQIQLFETEFQKIMSLINIFNYITSDKKLFFANSDFLSEIIWSFIEIFDFKIKYKYSISEQKRLNDEYNKLLITFRKKEQYFYLNVYTPSPLYNEKFLEKMSNTLVE
ncbi:MAG: hypothetical protein BZ136_09320 [Methanosphaera sp. rholeuAM74]|nr:MAG: hypothetical protein BZ136_09320 [Methanosphaera sp. rholeuAM74]